MQKIDYIVKITGKRIAMLDDKYVYLDTKEEVEDTILEEAQTAFEEYIETQRVALIKAEANAIILAKYPDYKQRNASLGLLSDEEITKMKEYIADIRAQSDALEADETKTYEDFVTEQ